MPIPIETFREAQEAGDALPSPAGDLVVEAAARLAEMPRERFVTAWVQAREVMGVSDDQLRERLNESLETLATEVTHAPERPTEPEPCPPAPLPISDYVEMAPTGWEIDPPRHQNDYIQITSTGTGCGGTGGNGGVVCITATSSVSINVSGGWAVNGCGGNGVVRINPPTPEELARAEAAQAEWVARQAEEKLLRAVAKGRARELLLERLSVAQREEFERDGSFRVLSQKGRVYRVRLGWTRNVDLLDGDGRVEAHFCLHPETDVPEEDNVLAQKLLLECCEDDFLRIANRSAPSCGDHTIVPAGGDLAVRSRVVVIPMGGPVATRPDGLPLVG